MVTRRRLIQASGVIGASAFATLNTPALIQAAEHLLAPASRRADLTGTRSIAVIRAGTASDELGIRAGAGVQPSGPQAIAALRDGRLAVLDTVNSRISYLSGGQPSHVQPLPGSIFALDLEVLGRGIAVLDPSAGALFEARSSSVTAQTLSRAGLNAVSRLTRFQDFAILVEEDFFTYDARIGRAGRVEGYPDPAGGRITVTYGGSGPARRRHAVIRQGGGVEFHVVTTYDLASVIALGRDDAGRLYLQITEIVPSQGGLDVDITLRRFAQDGAAAGAARVPVRGRHAHPRRVACFAPNGDAYALFPEATRVRILELVWSATVAPLAPIVSRIQLPKFAANAALDIANCRQTAIDIGNKYAHCTHSGGSWTATSANLWERNGALLPWYLGGGPGTYYELPYCWGGMHLPEGFIQKMNEGWMAGNRNYEQPGYVDQTSGVDCSGMIQQCWGVGGTIKQDDTMLMNWVTESGTQDVYAYLYPGDMWRLPGSHVRMHHYYPDTGGGDYMYEATLDWGAKCYHTFRPWSDYPDYRWCKGNFVC